MKRRPRCSLCKSRPAELHGYGNDGNPKYRSRCSTCRAEARVAHGLPARRGKEGKPGVPRCPECCRPWKACPMCGAALDPSAPAPSGGLVGAAAGGPIEERSRQDRGLLVLREIGNRRGRVSYEEFLAIAARLRYDRHGTERLRRDYLRRVKGDVELTRDGYELLARVGLRPPYQLPGLPRAGDGNGRRQGEQGLP